MPSELDQLSAVVRAQLEELLGDPVRRAELLGVQPFGPDQADMLDYHDSVIRSLLADRSLGRALNGPLWLSGASVVDGTVTASKLIVNTLESITINTGSLNITGTITAATAFPATGARVEIGSAGVWGYNGPTTTTFRLNTDGSGSIGIGTTAMSWSTSGVVTIPKAAIGTLTIADVSGGVLGGTYQTSTGTTRIDISTAGIVAYASSSETFRLNATTGAMTATGSFTIQSAASGARVVLSNAGGIEGYNASGRTFRINAATGAGFLGPESSSRKIEWDDSGVKIGGVYLDSATGKITASHLSVGTLSAISADLGTVTAGTLSADVIKAGTLTFGSSGTVNSTATMSGTFGGLNLANLTVTGNITLGSGGKIVDADTSEWNSSGLILKSAGFFGDAIKWQTSGVDKLSIWTYASGAMIEVPSGPQIHLATSPNYISLSGGSSGSAGLVGNVVIASLQDAAGSHYFAVRNISAVNKFMVDSYGRVRLVADASYGISTGWSSVGGTLATWAIYNIAGDLIGYIPVYSTRA